MAENLLWKLYHAYIYNNPSCYFSCKLLDKDIRGKRDLEGCTEISQLD